MRLLYVTDNGFYRNGENFYFSGPNYTHVQHLSKYFEEFVFVAREDQYDKSSFKINTGTSVHLFSKYNIVEMMGKLNDIMDNVDAVICYGINGYFASIIANRKKTPVISYNGGDVYDFLRARNTIKGRILAPIVRLIERDKFRRSDYAHYCDEFLVERYPAKGEVLVASGVNIEVDENTLTKRKKKISEKKIVSEKIVVGLIGHTNNNLKGIDTAIRAMSLIDNNYELQIVGRGDYKKYDSLIKQLEITGKIKFLGTKKAGDELNSWLDTVDIYIQPSLIEGLPRATIEAMSRGCPVISTNVGGLSHLVKKEFHIKENDYKELSTKIKMFSENNNLMLMEAEYNFNTSKNYAPDVRNKKYDGFYGMIVSSLKENRDIN